MRIEALNQPELHPIQAAFVAAGAMQSGYSTPAMVLGTWALLQHTPDPTEDQVRDMLSGILDRETAYTKPVEAILRAAAVLRGEDTQPFGPLILPPMTDGTNAVEVDPADPRPEASDAVPRLVPSKDVPEMAVVGKPEVKVDAVRLVKGNPAFTDDIELRGLLYAKCLYSPHAHARIRSIDTSKAAALPGVKAVITGADIEPVLAGSFVKDETMLAIDTVRYVGEPVAAVAATSPEAAREAAALIEVVVERFPGLTLGSVAPVPQTASLLTHSFEALTLKFSH